MVKTTKIPKRTNKQMKAPKRRPKQTQRRRTQMSSSQMVNANVNVAKRYMDPEGKVDPPASTSSLGNFTTLNSICRQLLVTSASAGSDLFVCVQWTPTSNRLVYWSGVTATPYIGVVQLGNLVSNVPTTSKPLRLAVTIRNTSVYTSTEGSVRVLCMPQNLDWTSAFATSNTLTNSFCSSIDAMIESNNKTVTFTAAELKQGKKWIFAPVSNVGYHNWYEQSEAYTLQNSLVLGAQADAMTTFLVKIPYVANRNTYDFTVRSQDGARYPANSVLANTAKSAARSAPGAIERIHAVASETSHIAEDVGHVFSSIGNAIPQVAGGIYNAIRAGQGLRSLFSSAAPLIEEVGEAAPLLLM